MSFDNRSGKTPCLSFNTLDFIGNLFVGKVTLNAHYNTHITLKYDILNTFKLNLFIPV